jgi:hypothetical protein
MTLERTSFEGHSRARPYQRSSTSKKKRPGSLAGALPAYGLTSIAHTADAASIGGEAGSIFGDAFSKGAGNAFTFEGDPFNQPATGDTDAAAVVARSALRRAMGVPVGGCRNGKTGVGVDAGVDSPQAVRSNSSAIRRSALRPLARSQPTPLHPSAVSTATIRGTVFAANQVFVPRSFSLRRLCALQLQIGVPGSSAGPLPLTRCTIN